MWASPLPYAPASDSVRRLPPMHVAALFRYPVKGLTPESCDSLDVLPGGRIAGDRVLGFRFDDAAAAGDAWGPKVDFAALVHTPRLAALRSRFDPATQRLRLQLGDDVLFDGVLDAEGRAAAGAALERYVAPLDESPVARRPHPFPLHVVGDGVTPRYQDREPGYATLHGRGSLAAVAAAAGEDPAVTERRFRSNIAVEGVAPWDEQRWVGRRLRIGAVEFDVANPVARCLATHANPETGERDRRIMTMLLDLHPVERPTFAVLMTSARGGSVLVGDPVEPG